MKITLLAATAAIALLITPAVAQSTGGTSGTTGSSGTSAGTSGSGTGSTGTDSTTTAPLPDTSTTGQNTSGSGTTGTNMDSGANTNAAQSGSGTNTETTGTGSSTTTTTAGAASANPMDQQAVMKQLSGVKAAQDFVTMAAMSDMFEIQSGKAASSNLKGKMAHRLAQRIVEDHTKSSRELMALAKQEKVDVQPPAQLDERHQQMLDALNNASTEPGATTSSTTAAEDNSAGTTTETMNGGSNTASSGGSSSSGGTTGSSGSMASSSGTMTGGSGEMTYDQIFAHQQVQAHEEGIALFQAYAQNGDNPKLQQFAEKGLPKLQEHLKMAQDLVEAQNKLMQKDQSQTQQ